MQKDLSYYLISVLLVSVSYGYNIIDISKNSINLADTNTTGTTTQTYNGSVYLDSGDFASSSDWLNAAINQTKLQITSENTTAYSLLDTAETTYNASVKNGDSDTIQAANKAAYTEA